MRSAAATVAAGLLLALAVGCGGTAGGPASGSLGNAIRYVPADPDLVLVIATDLEADRLEPLERLILDSDDRSLREEVARAARSQGLDYEDDVEPLLGNDAVAARRGDDTFVAALDTGDGDKLRKTLEKMGARQAGTADGATLYNLENGEHVAVDGDVLLLGPDESLRAAVARADGDDHLTGTELAERMPGLPEDAALRGYATRETLADRSTDAADLLAQLAASVPWFRAIRNGAWAIYGAGDAVAVDLLAVTDEDAITAADLPLAPGTETPEVLQGHAGEILGATANQSQTTLFLLRTARAAFPDSSFVSAVDEVERELGIDFEREVLRQFDGPSASAVSPDGRTFVARSAVRDPERLERLLERLAPYLPSLIDGLQGLRSEGMALLFLFAPDAPGMRSLTQVHVARPRPGDWLYHVTGLEGDGPSDLYFGVKGKWFAVASTEEGARDVVDGGTEPLALVEGGSVFRVPEEAEELAGRVPLPVSLPDAVTEVVGALDATTQRLRLSLRLVTR